MIVAMTLSDAMPPLPEGISIRPGGLQFVFSRSSGPGGQAVNKISSKATLRVAIDDLIGLDEHAVARLRKIAGHRLTDSGDILISADTSRSQLDNKRECVERLSALIAQAFRPPKHRKKSKPTRSMIRKRLESKRKQSQKKGERRARRVRDRDFD
jgi:ribosome-associated protein